MCTDLYLERCPKSNSWHTETGNLLILELENAVPWTLPRCTKVFKMQSGFIAASPDEWHILFDLVSKENMFIYVNMSTWICLPAFLMWTAELHCSTQTLLYTCTFRMWFLIPYLNYYSHLKTHWLFFLPWSILWFLQWWFIIQKDSEPKRWVFAFLQNSQEHRAKSSNALKGKLTSLNPCCS